jgi:hypothetical protein
MAMMSRSVLGRDHLIVGAVAIVIVDHIMIHEIMMVLIIMWCRRAHQKMCRLVRMMVMMAVMDVRTATMNVAVVVVVALVLNDMMMMMMMLMMT